MVVATLVSMFGLCSLFFFSWYVPGIHMYFDVHLIYLIEISSRASGVLTEVGV